MEARRIRKRTICILFVVILIIATYASLRFLNNSDSNEENKTEINQINIYRTQLSVDAELKTVTGESDIANIWNALQNAEFKAEEVDDIEYYYGSGALVFQVLSNDVTEIYTFFHIASFY